MATRSKSSQRWLKEHFSDPWVKKAQAEGMRSRAVYKLEELIEVLIARSGAALVQRIGHVAVLYRQSKDKRQIVLPRA